MMPLAAGCITKFVKCPRRIAGVNLFDTSGELIIYRSLPFGRVTDSTVNQSV